MPDVGSAFSEDNFREALQTGHINSITLFSKCHHGWSYHPTKVNQMHPTLHTNLLGRELAVCKELGVRAQVYLSAGIDERKAVEYPQFRIVVRGSENTLLGARFHEVCLNNDDYLDMLAAETREVLEMFGGQFDGLFFDICWPKPCVCAACIKTMLELGMNPENPADVEKHRKIVYHKFTDRFNRVAAAYDPELPVFYNCGDIPRYDRSLVYANTGHLEVESLPTGGWGYDHFPMSAAYCRVLGREFLGMTGKFHKTWGEFGGFKHPNALLYETSLSLASGAKCCIGDQLHPLGRFDMATYRLIGKAYAEVEKKEPWCEEVGAVTDIGLYTVCTEENPDGAPDIGANRILLEGHYLYNIIDRECEFSRYKLLIFPDRVRFDSVLAEKVKKYLAGGGRILLSGESGLDSEDCFFMDFGIRYIGRSPYDVSYLLPAYDMEPNGKTAYFMYSSGHLVECTDKAEQIAYMQNPYFNRTFRRFCSHGNTPNNPDSVQPGVVISGKIGYIAWDIFRDYERNGAYHQKQTVMDLLDRLLGAEKTLRTTLQSNGIVTLMEQGKKGRYINHLLYCVTKKRGDTEVIEDCVEVYNTQVSIRLPFRPLRVYLAPENRMISFTWDGNNLVYTVPYFRMHGMVVIERED